MPERRDQSFQKEERSYLTRGLKVRVSTVRAMASSTNRSAQTLTLLCLAAQKEISETSDSGLSGQRNTVGGERKSGILRTCARPEGETTHEERSRKTSRLTGRKKTVKAVPILLSTGEAP